jgi:hypothetical protein
VGWDAPYYVWRTAAVPLDGLARLGAVRSGSPLLFGLLMRTTGQNAFTTVAVVPPLLAGVVGLGAAVMVRAALRIRPIWVPVVGVLTWAAFGRVGIMNGHFDQLLNAALLVGSFAAAIAFVGTGRGAAAVALLLAGAGLAEWPFWAFGVAILLVALALFVGPALRTKEAGLRARLGPAVPLLGAIGASGVLTGLLFLAPPPGGHIGPSIQQASLRQLLRRRFLTRVKDPLRYIALPLAIGGGIIAARGWGLDPADAGEDGTGQQGRRMFVCLMVAWGLVTVVAGLAQLAGIPVAGGRLTNDLFAVPILTAVFVWWLARTLSRRVPGPTGIVAASVVVALALGAFGSMAWVTGRSRVPYFEAAGVRQAADAGRYVERSLLDRRVAFLVATPRGDSGTGGRWWHVVRAALPPEVVARAERFDGMPSAFKASPDVVGIVLQRFNKAGYAEAVREGAGAVVAPGVMVLGSPLAGGGHRPAVPPQADLRARTLLWLLPVLVSILFVAGSGWARGLLPADPVVRVGLAPALGAAVLSILALGWERVGLGFAPWESGLLIALASLAGWAQVVAVGRSGARRPALRSRGPLRP